VRPGEIIPADEPAPAGRHPHTATVAVTNSGRFDAYLTSHFAIAGASAALRFDPRGLDGARPLLPAGASVVIPAGETVDVEVTWS
jgi:urease subunit beta